MIDICYTVLHYGKEDITIKCIKSLIRVSKDYRFIIIVLDNGSENDSFKKIQSKFDGFESVLCLRSDENLGFSRGNNLLYQEAKRFDPGFIAVLNNDIEITQKDFIKTLMAVSNDSDAYVIGPDVYCPTGKRHQSPLYKSIPALDQLEEMMKGFYEIVNHPEEKWNMAEGERMVDVIRSILPQFIVNFSLYFKHAIKGTEPDLKYKNEIINPVLHGACIILTKRFIQKEGVLFEPDTHFYFEELLLAHRCREKNFKTFYTPRLKVIHHHSYATRHSSKNNKEHTIKTAQKLISAFEVYKKTVEATDNI